ncbi:anaerobic sulfite reductase subunit AsrA [Endozoicomonas sp. 4G]|uniref:anaerobic sulfite reductase subunit AsrA n=1 Tax=Endozoicomonas sp. 4G TaxID=2872754 RepID=UPI0020790816|nr:anaerobic sulfite reductase subunit AsrA [Endozoicomonas sp. 4G]
MSLLFSFQDLNAVFEKLTRQYRIMAPIRIVGGGRFSDDDSIQYGEVTKIEEVVWDEKSHFSPKEVIAPITQTLFHISNDQLITSTIDRRKILLFMRPCDIHGMSRLDDMFMKNGDNEDFYYKRLRDRVKVVMFECDSGWDNCFCVSMKTNKTEDYDVAVRFSENDISMKFQNEELEAQFAEHGQPSEFEPNFVEENSFTVDLPAETSGLAPQQIRDKIIGHQLFDEYDRRCVECGRCTTSCPTCSCYTVHDVKYSENAKVGERQRVWSSCIVPGFSDMAGGHSYRNRKSERLRYRLLHKMVDHNERFGHHMCVGCGRCDDRCPQYISFSNMVMKTTAALTEVEHA